MGVEKPDSRIFHEAARQLGVKPECVVHIGDSPEEDVAGAVAAGFGAILIDRENVHSGCGDNINSLSELGAWLNLGV